MNSELSHISRRAILGKSAAGVIAAAAGALALFIPKVEAHPYGQNRRVSRRTSRRTSRRVTRRHLYGIPAGARPFMYGGFRYYHVGGLYYYPYMLGGRTVYVQVDVSGGRPLPPPPPSQVSVEIDL